MTEFIPQQPQRTEGHFPSTQNTIVELHRLLAIFLASRLSEWELLDIYARSSTLTGEARAALAVVVAERKIDLQSLRQEEVLEERTLTAAENEKERKIEKRDASLIKWFLILGIPVIVVGALLRPDRAVEAFAAALVQGIGLFVFAWLVLKIKRRMSKK